MLFPVFKKFFIAAIFFIFTTCQIAFASNVNIPVDWSKVTKVTGKSDLAKYLEKAHRAGQNVIPVILANGLIVSPDELIQLSPSSLIVCHTVSNDGQNIKMIYEVTDYPGTKVANAYLSGDTSKLNQDEIKLYKIALGIVNEAKKKSKWQQQEAYIYKEIAARTSYYTTKNFNNQPRFVTAVGALIDGKANCQGYSDAFYMLGRMMGWEVGRMSGTVSGGAHMWNTITFNAGKADEKTYCVDITGGDSVISYGEPVNKVFNSYIYFNAPIEIMQATHSWNFDSAPKNIQGSIDENYSYCIYDELIRANNAEDGLKLLAKKISANKNFASVIFPYDKRFSTNPANWQYFEKVMAATNFNKKWWLHTRPHGKYIFVTACVW
ncbi:MAG: hypothetical protein IJT73_01660 [Selenomonadaceae bacterium]|nr:hypothetical protein [Selenomonadaceae bacterium]